MNHYFHQLDSNACHLISLQRNGHIGIMNAYAKLKKKLNNNLRAYAQEEH